MIFGAIAPRYVARFGLSVGSGVTIYISFLMLLAFVLAPGFFGFESGARSIRFHWLLVPALCCTPYLLYALGTGDFRVGALVKLTALAVFIPGIYALVPVRNPLALNWQDLAVASVLVAAVLGGWLRGIWNVPLNLDFMSRLFLIGLAAWTWTTVRVVAGLGYRFSFSGRICGQAALNFGWFTLIALPLSLELHFTRWNPHWRGITSFGLDFLEIFLFVALLEELFFRGFLQNLLTRTIGNALWAQVAVACLFGLFHILHAPFPNWRYVVLASIAGWFYGSAYRHTGHLTASALTHAAVDTVWRTWLSAH